MRAFNLLLISLSEDKVTDPVTQDVLSDLHTCLDVRAEL